MKDKKIKKNEIYRGTVCVLSRDVIGEQSIISVSLFEDNAPCIKLSDRLYFNLDVNEFLSPIDLTSENKNLPEGLYLCSANYEGFCNLTYVFEVDNNEVRFVGTESAKEKKGFLRKRK